MGNPVDFAPVVAVLVYKQEVLKSGSSHVLSYGEQSLRNQSAVVACSRRSVSWRAAQGTAKIKDACSLPPRPRHYFHSPFFALSRFSLEQATAVDMKCLCKPLYTVFIFPFKIK